MSVSVLYVFIWFCGTFPYLIFICFVFCGRKILFIFYLGLCGHELPYLVFLVYIRPYLSVDDDPITIPTPKTHPQLQNITITQKCQMLSVFLRIRCVPKRAAVCRHPMTWFEISDKFGENYGL